MSRECSRGPHGKEDACPECGYGIAPYTAGMKPYSEWKCDGCKRGTDTAHIEERYSLGIYAGRWCAPCWDRSGYRKGGRADFSELDAGENYDDEDGG